MGIIRKIGKIVLGFLFSTSLFLLLILYSTKNLISFETLSNVTLPILSSKVNLTEEQKNNIILYLRHSCSLEKYVTIPFEENITINCNEIENLKPENLEYFLSQKIISKIYYRNYDCKLISCIKEKNLMYFVSNQFYNEIVLILNYALIISIVIGILYLLTLESLNEKLLSFSMTFIIIGISYFILQQTLRQVSSNLQIPEIVVAKINEKFKILLYALALGILLLLVYLTLLLKDLYYSKRKKIYAD